LILRPLPMIVGALAAAAVLLVALVLDDDEAPELEGGGDAFGGVPVDPYAPQETNHPGVCDPTAKPGVLLFRQWVISKWGERAGSPQNIVRACSEGKSEHEQGRAWDLMTKSLEHGQGIVDALLAPDPVTGEPHALARRAGIMYIIWNHQIWRAYPYAGAPAGSWGPYTGGESAHTDHLHISFSKAGADGLTSLYDRIRQEFPNA
jgi:hypothetical protein